MKKIVLFLVCRSQLKMSKFPFFEGRKIGFFFTVYLPWNGRNTNCYVCQVKVKVAFLWDSSLLSSAAVSLSSAQDGRLARKSLNI